MASSAHLDTHVAVRLHDSITQRHSQRQKDLFEPRDLCISEFVRLEMQYLYEIGKITIAPQRIIAHPAARADVVVSTCPLSAIMDEAVGIRWARDPFDRLITANALAEKAELITRDWKTTVLPWVAADGLCSFSLSSISFFSQHVAGCRERRMAFIRSGYL